MEQQLQFSEGTPYPPIRVDQPNAQYASAMLANLASCNSEISAVSLYFYNSLVLAEQYPDLASCFHGVSIVEMHHMHIFGQLALLLGADPRLWSNTRRRLRYWSPACNQYPQKVLPLIRNAIDGERAAIQQYQHQIGWIQDEGIQENLRRILLDEEQHIVVFQSMEKELCKSEVTEA